MTLSIDKCAPYLSAVIYKANPHDTPKLCAILSRIRQCIREHAKSKGRPIPKFALIGSPVTSHGETELSCLHYIEQREPSWLKESEIKDTSNQLIILARRNNFYLLLFSDAAMRNFAVSKITLQYSAIFKKISQLNFTEMNNAFAGDKIKTLWLNGIHRRTSIKSDSKTLSGIELESALDPLGDQTYYYSSMRSSISLFCENSKSILGVSPYASRMWLGASKNWDDCKNSIDKILEHTAVHITQVSSLSTSLSILASVNDNINAVKDPYEMALSLPPELNYADTPNDADRWLQQFCDTASFKITPYTDTSNFIAEVYCYGEKIGSLEYSFSPYKQFGIQLDISKIEGFDGDDHHRKILKYCKNTNNITVYFDSGHTYSNGHFYSINFRDAQFPHWRWISIPSSVDIEKEKPLDGKRFKVESVGDLGDNSLFGFVVKHWPNLPTATQTAGQPTGWLICDDGAGESADFIHIDFDSTPPILTLIHAKGSDSSATNRKISAANYEVVVSQAVKNLRHIDKGHLKAKLQRNADGTLYKAVWHNGVRQKNRSDVLKIIDSLGTNFEKKVIILQPRVHQTAFKAVRAKMQAGSIDADVRRMQQLDSLLIAAHSNCSSLGANFFVYADGR